eukprot:3781441-Ditylum_brightwellii.AAC.1
MGRFTPSHLQACGDNNQNVIFFYYPFLGQDIAKVPCINWIHYKVPEAALYVQFGECKRGWA